MSIDDLSSTTRVFVSGLPPSLTSKDLRSFIGENFHVTDAHVLQDRRIGFVGLADHDSAERAVKYFHKSFIRMSKISVELAKPVDVKRNNSGQAAPVSQRGPREPHNGSTTTSRSQKRKRDNTDDGELLRGNTLKPPMTAEASPKSGETESSENLTTNNDALVGDYGTDTFNDPSIQEDKEEPPIASDSDWLRGKTNRVLDLQDPDSERRAPPTLPVETLPSEPNGFAPAADQDVKDKPQDQPRISNARLFIRNLAFDATEDDLRSLLTPLGKVDEIHVVKDKRTSKSKGLAYAQFREQADAQNALQSLDGSPFQGRLLHILPASDKKEQKLSDFEISKLPLKKQKEIQRKANATTSSFNWNSMYMNPDAVLASVADRLGVSKSELLDPLSTDAAVKQARAETSIIQETKEYLRSQGIKIGPFSNGAKHDRAILLKNFPFGTSLEELTTMLTTYGSIERLVFPPSGTMAIALFEEAHSAALALKKLAYSNVKGSVLYLEKAPQDLFDEDPSEESAVNTTIDRELDASRDTTAATSTVFVRNLNFATTTTRLIDVFKPLTGFLSARVKTRTDAARPGQVLSMGFGFVEFHSKHQAATAVATMNGNNLDGHHLLVQLSNKTLDAAEERRVEDKMKKGDQERTKVIIKNLPFEASKKDVKALFGAYGKLRSVRLPKKFDNSARGFAFAEFVTAKEAKNAVEALSSTHLLGRRLVLDFAESEIDDPEEKIRAMEKKAGRQSHLTAVNKMMTGSARRKFNADAVHELDD